MTAESKELLRLRAALRSAGWRDATTITAGTSSITSPMRVALEWAGFWIADHTGQYYAKVLYADTAELVDFALSAAAANCAGEANVAPRLVLSDPLQQVLIFEALGSHDWRAAFVSDLFVRDSRNRVSLDALWDQKRRLHRHAATLPVRALDTDLRHLHDLCARDRAYMPDDSATLGEYALRAAAALRIAQQTWVPIHGDGAASNVMRGVRGELCLIDFDRGGLGDPWLDVAVTLNECFQFESEWRSGISDWAGACSEADYARCRLYAFVDDWIWTLSMLWLSETSRRGLDFLKLAQWTLLRCRQTLMEGQLDVWLERIGCMTGGTPFRTCTPVIGHRAGHGPGDDAVEVDTQVNL